MTIYQKAQRVDLAILHALWFGSDSPECIPFEELYCRMCPGKQWVERVIVGAQLHVLCDQEFIYRTPYSLPSGSLFKITTKGHSWLLAQTLSLTSQVQVAAMNCDPEPEPEETDPAQALLCVDEDELNDWWDALDVEAKADAFAQWSLGNDGRNSHAYIEPAPRPTKMSDDEAAEFIKQHAARIRDIVLGEIRLSNAPGRIEPLEPLNPNFSEERA